MDWALLLAALIAVESGNNPHAIGDSGRSIGPLQIQRAAVQDVNDYYGLAIAWEQCFDESVARQVCVHYLRRWGADGNYERASRCWNGGPRGHLKVATLPYWRKVKKELERLGVTVE